MPRSASAGYQALLDAESASMCILVEIVREDGEVFRYTSHDKPVVFETETFVPATGVTLTAFEVSAGSGVDNYLIQGLVSTGQITERDIHAGLFKNALVTHWTCSWEDPSVGGILLSRGHLGNIKNNDLLFNAEFRSLSQLLSQQFVQNTTPGCRHKRLGEPPCNADMTGRVHDEDVVSVTSAHVIVFANVGATVEGRYIHGFVEFLDGENAGIERLIKNATISGGNNVITLQEPFPFTIEVGETAQLTEGCDHLFGTCVDEFDNGVNYGGEPHLPGNNKIMERGR
jgi:uncharacterized phage protein (TIGR02218 family)